MSDKRDIREICFEVSVQMGIDWPELSKQRTYLANEADNKRGEEAELLEGIMSILDCVADAVYDANPDREAELLAYYDPAGPLRDRAAAGKVKP